VGFIAVFTLPPSFPTELFTKAEHLAFESRIRRDLPADAQEAWCHWIPSLADPYRLSDWTRPVAYVYSPAFLQLVAPLKALTCSCAIAVAYGWFEAGARTDEPDNRESTRATKSAPAQASPSRPAPAMPTPSPTPVEMKPMIGG
jgi:hypothetical protein